MNSDLKWMRQAIELGRKGVGTTSPNPRVGAVVVRSGRAVGEGWHAKAGEAHAEAIALRAAGALARGATLYLTLEPCAHFGRTPPCVEAVLSSGVRRVVVGEKDPNPKTNGRGLRALRRAGVRTTVGVLRDEAHELNLPFHKWVRTGLPFVTLKVAQSLDGRIATSTGHSRWITSSASRCWAHALRYAADAVMVGVETILRDDPKLTVRSERRKPSLKIVLDSDLRTPPRARIFNGPGRVIIAATDRAGRERLQALSKKAEVILTPARAGRVDLRRLLRELAKRNVLHLLVEGGGEVHASFVQQKLADEIYLFVAPLLIGGKRAPSSVMGLGASTMKAVWHLKRMSFERVGPDIMVHGFLR